MKYKFTFNMIEWYTEPPYERSGKKEYFSTRYSHWISAENVAQALFMLYSNYVSINADYIITINNCTYKVKDA